MKWKMKNNTIKDEHDNLVCVVPENSDDTYNALLLLAPAMYEAILEYMVAIENHKTPGKKVYSKFQKILEKMDDL